MMPGPIVHDPDTSTLWFADAIVEDVIELDLGSGMQTPLLAGLTGVVGVAREEGGDLIVAQHTGDVSRLVPGTPSTVIPLNTTDLFNPHGVKVLRVPEPDQLLGLVIGCAFIAIAGGLRGRRR
jgi:sugar lactone lactonase YvrE